MDTVSNKAYSSAGGTWHTGGHSQQQSLQLCWGYLAYRWTQSATKPTALLGVPDILVDTVSNPSNSAGGTWHTGGHSQQQSLQLCWGYLAYRWTQSATKPTALLEVPDTHMDTQSATFKAYNAVRAPVRQVHTQSGATPPTLPVVPATQMNIQSATKPTTLPWVPAIQVDKVQLGIVRVRQQQSFQVCYGHPPHPTQSATRPTSFPGRYPPDRWICCAYSCRL